MRHPEKTRTTFDGLFDKVTVIRALTVFQLNGNSELKEISFWVDLESVTRKAVEEVVGNDDERVV